MKIIPGIACVCMILASSALGQDPQQKIKAAPPVSNTINLIPTVDQILNKYVEAVGGKTATEKLKTRMTKSSFVLSDGTRGSVEIYAK